MKTGDGKYNQDRVQRVVKYALEYLNNDEIGGLIDDLHKETGSMQIRTILRIREQAAEMAI